MIFRGHRVKNEKKTISCDLLQGERMARGSAGGCGRSLKGPQYFKPFPPHRTRCPMVIRYFFPNVHANTPFIYIFIYSHARRTPFSVRLLPNSPSAVFSILLLLLFCRGLRMEIIRVVVATQPIWGTFMKNWVILGKQLLLLLFLKIIIIIISGIHWCKRTIVIGDFLMKPYSWTYYYLNFTQNSISLY